MSLAELPKRSIIRQQPQIIKQEQAKADAIIEYAKKVMDWPLLEEAIAAKIEQQEEFVGWWRENVRRPGQGNVADLATIPVDEAERLAGITKEKVSRWNKRLSDKPKFIERQISAARRKAELDAAENHRAEGTGENEWFTPVEYIEAAREVLGEIDLDPATHPIAQETIKATKFFTRKDDGLSKLWHGRVWLNPPYAQPDIGYFVTKLVEEVTAKRVTAAILLTHNYTDTIWFHTAAAAAQAICFTRGRIRFTDIDGELCAPTQGQAFCYFGPHTDVFWSRFVEYGIVMIPMRNLDK